MKLEEKLKELQYKLDKLEVYKKISAWTKFPVELSNKIDAKAAQEVLADIVALANTRVAELDSEETGYIKISTEVHECSFEEEEVMCLKLLAKQLMVKSSEVEATKEQKHQEVKVIGTIKQGQLIKILSVSRITPYTETTNICAYDIGRVMRVEGEMITFRHEATKNTHQIPIDDVEIVTK